MLRQKICLLTASIGQREESIQVSLNIATRNGLFTKVGLPWKLRTIVNRNHVFVWKVGKDHKN